MNGSDKLKAVEHFENFQSWPGGTEEWILGLEEAMTVDERTPEERELYVVALKDAAITLEQERDSVLVRIPDETYLDRALELLDYADRLTELNLRVSNSDHQDRLKTQIFELRDVAIVMLEENRPEVDDEG